MLTLTQSVSLCFFSPTRIFHPITKRAFTPYCTQKGQNSIEFGPSECNRVKQILRYFLISFEYSLTMLTVCLKWK